MLHRYNINAFLKGSGSGSPLVEAYNKLVAIELAIKGNIAQSSGVWGNIGHRIISEIAKEDTSFSTQLGNLLTQLKTRKQNGSIGSVSSSNYPELRYLVHISDFPIDGNDDSKIISLLQKIDDTILFLRSRGYSL